jgi:putative membrane protein
MKSQDDLEALANSKAFSLDVVDLSTEDQAIGGAGTEGAIKGIKKGDEKYDMKGLIGD